MRTGCVLNTVDSHLTKVQDTGQQSDETDDAEAQSKAVEQAATKTERRGKGKMPPPADARTTGTTEPSSSHAAAAEKAPEGKTTKEGHAEPSSPPELWSDEAKSEDIYGPKQEELAPIRRTRVREGARPGGGGNARPTRQGMDESQEQEHPLPHRLGGPGQEGPGAHQRMHAPARQYAPIVRSLPRPVWMWRYNYGEVPSL